MKNGRSQLRNSVRQETNQTRHHLRLQGLAGLRELQSLTVDLGNGDETGGRSFLGLSGELRQDIGESWGVVAFADAGYISAEATPGSGGEWQSGAGLGVRYQTGIGPIRLDVATPTGGDTGSGVQIYIGIGQAF